MTALIIRGNKLNILLAFMSKSYIAMPKNIRLNFTHNFIMSITNEKRASKRASANFSKSLIRYCL